MCVRFCRIGYTSVVTWVRLRRLGYIFITCRLARPQPLVVYLSRVAPCLLDRLSRAYRLLRCVGASSSTTSSSGCLRLGRVQGGQTQRLLVSASPVLGAALQSLSVSASSWSFASFSLFISKALTNKAPTHTLRISLSLLTDSVRDSIRLPLLPW